MLDAAIWEQTPLVVRQLVIHLLAIIRQQDKRIRTLTEVIKVMPETCACGQQEFSATTPYYTHQVIELLQIEMSMTHVVLHELRCPRRGRILKADLPAQYRYGYRPRLTARIGELSGRQRDCRGAVQAFCTSVLGVPINTPSGLLGTPLEGNWPFAQR